MGSDARTVVPSDGDMVRESDGLRWYRCLRCDCWLPEQPPRDPTRDRMPARDDIWVPLRGRSLRDLYVLRLIAAERAVHVVVLSGLAIAVFIFIGNRKTLRHDYVAIVNAITGSSGGPNSVGGILGDVHHLFLISPSHLYVVGLVLVAYATLEAVEMVGLWLAKRWAEYLAFVATTALVPLEIYELAKSFGVFKLVTFLVNVAIVVFLLYAKRLFGLRGGHAAELAQRQSESGWEAIDRHSPPVPPPSPADGTGARQPDEP